MVVSFLPSFFFSGVFFVVVSAEVDEGAADFSLVLSQTLVLSDEVVLSVMVFSLILSVMKRPLTKAIERKRKISARTRQPVPFELSFF